MSEKRNPCTAVTKGVMLIVYHISVWDSKVIVVLFPLLLCVKPLQTRAFTTRQELCMMQKSSQEKDSGDPFSFFLSLLELSFQVPKKVLSDDLKTKKCCHNDFLKSCFLICENRLKRSYVRCCCNTHFLHKRQKCTTDPCFIISLNAVQVSFTFYMHSKQTLSNIVCWLFTVTSLICLENGVSVHESSLWPKRVSHKQTLQK